MQNFMMAVNVVVPLIVYMVVGAWIRRQKLFTEEQFKSLNGVIFKIFIPLALFFDVYESNLSEALQGELLVLVLAGIFASFGIAYVWVSKVIRDQADAASVIQGIYRSNYVLFGLTIAQSLCGENGVAQVAAFAAVVVPVFNILAVILFETKRGGNVMPAKIGMNILKNPLVQAGVLACLVNIAGISIPKVLASPLGKLGDIASPLALVALGGMLSFESIVKHRKYLVAATVNRLITVPLVMVAVAVMLGYRGEALVMMVAIFGAPTTVSSVPMAQSMGANGKLAGEIVAATAVFSVITIFLFVLVLSSAGLI